MTENSLNMKPLTYFCLISKNFLWRLEKLVIRLFFRHINLAKYSIHNLWHCRNLLTLWITCSKTDIASICVVTYKVGVCNVFQSTSLRQRLQCLGAMCVLGTLAGFLAQNPPSASQCDDLLDKLSSFLKSWITQTTFPKPKSDVR